MGPSDTKREHGSSTACHHILVAPAGPKRRLLHAQGMEQHGLTRGSSQTSHFPLLQFGNTWNHKDKACGKQSQIRSPTCLLTFLRNSSGQSVSHGKVKT